MMIWYIMLASLSKARCGVMRMGGALGQLPESDAEASVTASPWSEGRMYAISFDLLQSSLHRYYPGGDTTNAYGDIRRVLEKRGFWNQQGSVYFSRHKDPVVVWQVVMELKDRYDWFAKCVCDLRMLRIDENSNLMPLLGQPTLPLGEPFVKPQSRSRNQRDAPLLN